MHRLPEAMSRAWRDLVVPAVLGALPERDLAEYYLPPETRPGGYGGDEEPTQPLPDSPTVEKGEGDVDQEC